MHADHSFPFSIPLSSPISPLPSTPRFFLHDLFRKEQVSKEQEPKRTKQNTIRQGKSPHVEAEQGNPMGGRESQEQVKESVMHPLPLLGKAQSQQPYHTHRGQGHISLQNLKPRETQCANDAVCPWGYSQNTQKHRIIFFLMKTSAL